MTSSSRSRRGCAFTLLAPPGLQPGLRMGLGFSTSCMPCFWHRLPSAVLRCQQQDPFHVSQTRTRQAFPPASQHLSVPEVRDSRLVPGPIQPQVAHLVCVCQSANVRDFQDHVPFARQSLSDILQCEVCCLSVNSYVRTRGTTDRHTILSQVCSRDVAPTWRQRQMDKWRTWGLKSLCSVCFSFSDIPRETTKSVPTVDIPSTLLNHSSEPCSFHDSMCRHDENAPGSCVVPKRPSNMQLWLRFTCNCSCYCWVVVD